MKIPATLFFSLVIAAAPVACGEEPVDYLTQIKPVLAERCFACHGALKQEAGLRLDAAPLLLKVGEGGAVIVAGKAGESMLLEKIAEADPDLRMPPEGKPLSEEQIALVRTWIDQGAVAPNEPIPPDPREHWAFQPPRRPAAPNGSADWLCNDIDRFIAAGHQQRGLAAVGEAPRSILLRRVYLDLVGLPPSRDELRAFLDDRSPNAWEQAVNRLLDSPAYGQRWARHWMDVWRYSDPSGYGKEIRDGRMHIWRWRDWIVESLNSDKSYDRMVVEMLAADEAAPDDIDALRATGFLARNWYKFNRNVWLDNIVEHSSKAFLGVTMNCARCHDHKYDPFAQNEYYRMRAIFEPHDVRDDPLPAGEADLVRAFDANAATPTYPFIQGDELRPDKEHPLTPGIPAVLGNDLAIEPIDLPIAAYYPALRPENHAAALAQANQDMDAAQQALANAEQKLVDTKEKLAKKPSEPAPEQGASNPTITATEPSASGVPVITDDFSRLDEQSWTVEGGNWTAIDGRLVQDHGDTQQYRLLSTGDHPRDFRAQLRLRITGGQMWRSVGLGFDCHGKAMNAVYLSAYSGGSKVQVTLQNASGGWAYPQEGARPYPVQLDQDYQLQVAVQDHTLNVSVDGQLLVTFTLPAEREPGKIAIFTFSAQAAFDDLRVETLPPGATLSGKVESAAPQSPAKPNLQSAVIRAESALVMARLHLAAVEARRDSLVARYAAERAKYGLDDADAKSLASIAARAERLAAVCNLEEQVLRDKQQLAEAEQNQAAGDAKAAEAVSKAKKSLDERTKQLSDAQAKLAGDDATYSPLGPIHPKTSTGRRLALARWMTDRANPLTARVAVNHIWLRHFDAPLVERMFDFGLRSPRPEHADLLDWLAVELMDHGWSMKHLHKLIVTSGVYRLNSRASDGAERNRQIDPDNHFLWRMNARRMEAEVARDSLLHVGGSLDPTMGGPPIDHNQGQTVFRRSIYFRQDKERQMTFLSLFDGAKVNECYRRKATVSPQQALAMYNSQIAATQSAKLAANLPTKDEEFVTALFEHVLCRLPTKEEQVECAAFLETLPEKAAARQQLALVLLNHNDFVTVR